MVPAALAGIWAATQTPPAVSNQYVQPANDPWPRFAIPVAPIDETMHYFLVIRTAGDGTIAGFVRNPEANLGAALGTRTIVGDGDRLRLQATGESEISGRVNADGTLTLERLPFGASSLTFHRPKPDELRWYYPSASDRWVYREPLPGDDGWPTATLAQAGLREAPIAKVMREIVASARRCCDRPTSKA